MVQCTLNKKIQLLETVTVHCSRKTCFLEVCNHPNHPKHLAIAHDITCTLGSVSLFAPFSHNDAKFSFHAKLV